MPDPDATDETSRVRQAYERYADRYDAEVSHMERWLLADGRQWACGQTVGDVLEIAIGTDRNLPFYPASARLTGIDVSAAMLAKAQERAETLGRDVVLGVGDAQALDFPDDTFDTVVMTLALCTIPDERKAIAEAKRVLRENGRLVVLEHIRSPLLSVRFVRRLLDPLLVRWKGDHVMREPLEPLRREGSPSCSVSVGSGASSSALWLGKPLRQAGHSHFRNQAVEEVLRFLGDPPTDLGWSQ